MSRPFEELLGPWPETVDLQSETLEVEDRGAYRREKVSYAVSGTERVLAYVNVPKHLSAPAKAVVCHHQHASQFDLGKSETVGLLGDPNMAYAHELASRGFVTISPDAIGFEDRNWSPDGKANVLWFEMATRLVQGRTLLAACLAEVSVALDYLSTRSEVDRKRLGFMGHSYGGRMAIWAPAFDSRIRASVSNCGCIPYRDSYSRDTGLQAEFVVPNFAVHHDLESLFSHYNDCALLLSASTDDKWSRGATDVYEGARAVLGEGVELALYDNVGHAFNAAMRERAYTFLSVRLTQ